MNSDSKNFYWNLGRRIRSFREKKHYTAEEFSEQVGISTKYLYEIENGKVRFSTEILYKISHSLGISADVILAEEGMTMETSILSEIMGKFTSEEKKYIKKAIVNDILGDL